MCGGDARDAHAHSPPPACQCYVSIDDQCAKWHKQKFPNETLDQSHVLPMQHALQGHPESGVLWEKHISQIMKDTEFQLVNTTHDRSIYKGTFNSHKIFLL